MGDKELQNEENEIRNESAAGDSSSQKEKKQADRFSRDRKNQQFIEFLEKQYKADQAEYEAKLKEREKTLGIPLDRIRKLELQMMSRDINIRDFRGFLGEYIGTEPEDKEFRKELKKRTEKGAADSYDRYMDFILYQLNKAKVEIDEKVLEHLKTDRPWTKEEILSLKIADEADNEQLIQDFASLSLEQLSDLSTNGLAKAPKNKINYHSLEFAFRDFWTEELLKDFDSQTKALRSVREGVVDILLSENSFNGLSEEQKSKAKAQLSTLKEDLDKVLLLVQLNPGTPDRKNSRDIFNYLKAFTATDSESGMSIIDRMLNSYLDYALIENQAAPGDEEIKFTKEQEGVIKNLQQFSQTVAELHESYSSRFEGDLRIPGESETMENGKKIHRIDATGFELTSGVMDDGEEIKIDFVDASDRPLFDGEPCADHVSQGHVGDCYMLAGLTIIAEQDPGAIKGMMKDNGKTVTVRFYNEQNEPVYVTVTKTIPVKPGEGKDVFAQGSLWVQMVEKAYVCSGLHQLKLHKTEQIEAGKITKLAYNDIKSGHVHLFARQVIPASDIADLDYHERISFSDKEKKGPEEAKIKHMMDCFKKGMILSCGSQSLIKENTHLKEGFTYSHGDLVSRHAYTISNIEEENGKYYVTVRNPHGRQGMESDGQGGHKLLDSGEAQGYSRLDYDTFKDFVDYVFIDKIDLSQRERLNLPTARKYVNLYSFTAEKIAKTLEEYDNPFFKSFKNSKEFNDFRTAADGLVKEMKKTVPDRDSINNHLKDFFKAAEDYRVYCKDVKQVDPQTAEGRSLARYKMALLAEKMQNIFEENAGITDPEQWREFSGKELDNSLRMPINAYEKIAVAEADAEQFVGTLGKNNLKIAGVREKFFDDTLRFLKSGGSAFGPVLDGKVSASKLMKYYEKNQNDLTMIATLCKHSEKIAEMMSKDGYFAASGTGKAEFLAACETLKPLYEGIKVRTDAKTYKAETSLPDLAKITGTPRDVYAQKGYGFKQEIKSLDRCIKESRAALKQYAEGNANALKAPKPRKVSQHALV